ncbi:hypothetical protein BVRB_1g014460 [Beta vulgaris subsp. vulgaris]|nr:hypothetical protein BVRB_1g014460 [Beta vulgaris subsp. vulgaris]
MGGFLLPLLQEQGRKQRRQGRREVLWRAVRRHIGGRRRETAQIRPSVLGTPAAAEGRSNCSERRRGVSEGKRKEERE